MKVADNVGVGVLANLPLVRIQFSTDAFGLSPQQVIADVALNYASVETLQKVLTEIVRQIHEVQAGAAAVNDPDRVMN